MATLDLTSVRDKDGFVVYFGGQPNEVDTYTFANALVALSDAFQEINNQVNPGYSLELRLEAVGSGSFKARIREIPKTLKSAFKFADNRIIWPILVTWFYTQVIDPDKTVITVKTDEVVIENGADRVIVPREAYNQAKAVPKERVGRHVARAIDAVEGDPNVSSLGIYKDMTGEGPPALLIQRDEFAIVRLRAQAEEGNARKRTQLVEATVGIIKAVFARGDRKWDFVWNGVKIGATIGDPIFMADVMSRRYKIGAGDAIEVTMEIEQEYDDALGVWLNAGYRITSVKRFIPGISGQEPFNLDGQNG
jgi:hypothetical protein